MGVQPGTTIVEKWKLFVDLSKISIALVAPSSGYRWQVIKAKIGYAYLGHSSMGAHQVH